MVKIRLQRGGRTHRPVYTIVAANSREPRDGKFLEKLGQYDPNATEVLNSVKVEEIKAWIAKGAQLTDTVKSLFRKNGVKLQ
jgi:small subunit ribosomal protein S16